MPRLSEVLSNADSRADELAALFAEAQAAKAFVNEAAARIVDRALALSGGAEPAGLIVNSLASVSLEPPLVAFCPSRSSLTWCRMRRTGRLGVNILRRQHERFVTRGIPPGAGTDSPAWIGNPGHAGVPLLTDALASFEFETIAEHPPGDHWIVVGQLDNLRISPTNDPLIFFAGTFHAVHVTN